MKKQNVCTLYLVPVSVQARSLNLNWSQNLNWSWKDLKGLTAVQQNTKRKKQKQNNGLISLEFKITTFVFSHDIIIFM